MNLTQLNKRRLQLINAVVEGIYNLINSVSYPWLDENNYTITTGILAPDASNTAVRTETNTGGQMATRRLSHTLAGDNNYSCYARKVVSTSNAQFRIVISGSKGGGFDLNTGTINLSAGGTTNEIEDIGGGWYRCSVGLASGGGETVLMEYVNLNIGDTFEWWGQQHTLGSLTVQPFQFTDGNTVWE